MELLLVFPKKFEFAKYLLSLEKCNNDAEIKTPNFIKIIHKANSERSYRYFMLTFDESDIMFLLELNRFQQSNVGLYWYMFIGTSGLLIRGNSDNKVIEEDYLEKVFYCHEAVKFDRGELKGMVMIPKMDKSLHVKTKKDPCLSMLSDRTMPIRSSNFVVTEFEDKNFDLVLFDMETYDSMMICEYNNEKTCGSLRIISDIIGNPQSRLIRYRVNFNNVSAIISKFLRFNFQPTNDVICNAYEDIVEENTLSIMKKITTELLRENNLVHDFMDKFRSRNEMIINNNEISKEYILLLEYMIKSCSKVINRVDPPNFQKDESEDLDGPEPDFMTNYEINNVIIHTDHYYV